MDRRRLVILAAGLVALVGGGLLLWRATPLSALAQPEQLTAWLASFARSRASFLIVVAIYLAAGFVLFPVTLLIAATAAVFDPLMALAASFTGALSSAAAVYGAGATFSNAARSALGPTFRRVNEALVDRGVIAIAVIRLLPVAPFTLVNMAAGSLAIPFKHYMLGTALGMAPGIVMLTIFGRQVRSVWERPTPLNVLAVLGALTAWIALSLGLQRLVSRRRSRRSDQLR